MVSTIDDYVSCSKVKNPIRDERGFVKKYLDCYFEPKSFERWKSV